LRALVRHFAADLAIISVINEEKLVKEFKE